MLYQHCSKMVLLLFFVANAPLLSQNIDLVKDIYEGTRSSLITNPVAFQGALYFSADDGVHGPELWKSGVNGAELVADTVPGPSGGYVNDLVEFKGRLYFRVSGGSGSGLWTSDGTTAGTHEIGSQGGESHATRLTVFGDYLYYGAYHPNYGWEAWRTDGTGAGCELFLDANPGTAHGHAVNYTVAGDQLFFVAVDPSGHQELYRTSGDPSDVTRIPVPGGRLNPQDLTAVGDVLYFLGNDRIHGWELWKTDGTGAGTEMMADLCAGDCDYGIRNLTSAGDTLYFNTGRGNQAALYKTEGETLVQLHFFNNLKDGYPYGFTPVNDVVYFAASNGVDGRELWVTDGTSAGTRQILDINPGPLTSNPRGFTEFNGSVYFQASVGEVVDPRHGGVANGELWKTDGTAAGTVLVEDLVPGEGGSYPYHLTVVNHQLYMVAKTPETGSELYVYEDVIPCPGGGDTTDSDGDRVPDLCDLCPDDPTISDLTPDAWAENTTYAAGDQVSFGGDVYECVQGHTAYTGWEPVNTPALWNFLPICGLAEWHAGVAYAVGDVVTWQGANYRAIQAHTAIVGWEPSNVPALWEAL